MNIFLITLEAVASLLGIGVLGYWIIGRRRVSRETIGFLSDLAIDIAVPCLVLASLLMDFKPGQTPGWWQLPLWWLGFLVLSLVFSLLSSLAVGTRFRMEFAMSLFFQNGIFFPLTILIGLFGPRNQYLVPLFLFISLHPSIVFSTYHLFFPATTKKTGLPLARVFNPILVCTAAGLTISLAGLQEQVPVFIKTVLNLVGAMALPLFMLILGGNLFRDLKEGKKEGRSFNFAEVLKFCLAKNFLLPMLALGLLIQLRPPFEAALIIMLQASVPPISAVPILAERAGGDQGICSQFTLGSFLCSIFSIPLFLHLFSRFFPFP